MMEARPHSTNHSQDNSCDPEEYYLEDVLDSFEFNSNSLESLPIAKSEPNYKSLQDKERYKLYLNSEIPLRRIEARARRLGKSRPRFYPLTDEARTILGAADPQESHNRHDDQLLSCSCCSCYISQNKKDRRQKIQSNGKIIENKITKLAEMSHKGRRGHQPQFLKTISIIDTLSELGADVNQLTEDKRISPRLAVRVTNPRNTLLVREPSGKKPFACPDLQQYSEKIYDAMTRKEDNEQLKYQQRSYYSDGRRKKMHPETRENGLSLRVEDGGIPNDKLMNGARERGRTPDWIRKIFEIAKKGNLELLKQNMSGMEDTLVRNISDHSGNNLLHVMAVYGHLTVLAWLLSTKQVLSDGLQDENKYGLTPFVCAIKYGRIELVQWLVENTSIGGKIRCQGGERSLLHTAAKYSQEQIVTWLVEYMVNNEISLDNKDHKGNTALHMASRSGNSRVCSILLQHGADVTVKNDIGQTAWEICVRKCHLACAEYLCVHETGLSLASDLTSREAELEAATTDNNEIRINFKEMMAISRRLLRERDDAVRELSKFHDMMIEGHDEILLALQSLTEENTSLREQINGLDPQGGQSNDVENVVSYVTSIHERWQSAQKILFGSALVNIKHRMLLVEEAWNKLRHKNHRTVASTHHPLDIFQSKLCGIRKKGNPNKLADIPSLYSSEESLGSLYPFSDEESYKDILITSTPYKRGINDPVLIISTNGSPSLNDNAKFRSANSEEKSEYKTSVNRAYWNDPSLSTSLNILSELGPGERLAKEEINARLKEFALTSESGSCSVLEVIEPSSEESDNHFIDEERKNIVTKSKTTLKDIRSKPPHERKTKKIRHKSEDVRTKLDLANSSESGNDSNSISISNYEPKPFLVNEASTGAAAVNASDLSQRPYFTEDESTTGSCGSTNKRKGFLHKFIKPPLWNVKKVKNNRKLDTSIKDDIDGTQHLRKLPEPIVEAKRIPEGNGNGSSQDRQILMEETSSNKLLKQSENIREVDAISESNDAVNEIYNEISKNVIQANKCSRPPNRSPPSIPARKILIENDEVTMEDFDISSENHLNSIDSGQKTIVSEVRSVATSEDSGIVARPASSASKSDSVSRPESSSSTFPPYKTEFSLRKSTLSLTQEMLSTPGLNSGGRMSPAPSEVSKTESALSPPSHASDLSKSESTRQSSKSGLVYPEETIKESNLSYAMTILPMKKDLDVKTAAIIEISDEKLKNSLSQTEQTKNSKCRKAWYELSDEESDILLPDEFNIKNLARNPSSDDEREVC